MGDGISEISSMEWIWCDWNCFGYIARFAWCWTGLSRDWQYSGKSASSCSRSTKKWRGAKSWILKRGHSSKIHAACADENTAIDLRITAGQAADHKTAEIIIEETITDNPYIKAVAGDKAYDTAAIRKQLDTAGKPAVIPPKSNRSELIVYDQEKYKKRDKIERFFAKLKEFRAIATRYDKLARRFLAGIQIAMIAIFLRNSQKLIVNTA